VLRLGSAWTTPTPALRSLQPRHAATPSDVLTTSSLYRSRGPVAAPLSGRGVAMGGPAAAVQASMASTGSRLGERGSGRGPD